MDFNTLAGEILEAHTSSKLSRIVAKHYSTKVDLLLENADESSPEIFSSVCSSCVIYPCLGL